MPTTSRVVPNSAQRRSPTRTATYPATGAVIENNSGRITIANEACPTENPNISCTSTGVTM
jgi:hypothetical protein